MGTQRLETRLSKSDIAKLERRARASGRSRAEEMAVHVRFALLFVHVDVDPDLGREKVKR